METLKNNPLVAVILPTYKRTASMLSRAIFSVLSQTYENLELIVIDDNADDLLSDFRNANIKLVNSISQNDNRIRLILNETNLGGALSRNVGIKNAFGAYITFLDDDDIFLPDKILHQISFMLAENLDCSFTDLSIYDSNDKLIDKRSRNDLKSMDTKYLLKYHLTKTISGTETFMVKKDILDAIGYFDNVMTGHEFYLMYKILCYPDIKIAYYKSDDIKAYRTSAESISNGPNKIKGEKNVYLFRKQHFDILSLKEKRYVKFRHHIVLSVSYYRRKHIFKCVCHAAIAFFIDPFICLKEICQFKK